MNGKRRFILRWARRQRCNLSLNWNVYLSLEEDQLLQDCLTSVVHGRNLVSAENVQLLFVSKLQRSLFHDQVSSSSRRSRRLVVNQSRLESKLRAAKVKQAFPVILAKATLSLALLTLSNTVSQQNCD